MSTFEGSSCAYINVPNSISIDERNVVGVEWIRRVYAKDPYKMQRHFMFIVVQEILRTMPINLVPQRTSTVEISITEGLHAFLNEYAHLMLRADSLNTYRPLSELPDRVKICGETSWIGVLKQLAPSNKFGVSSLISTIVLMSLESVGVTSFGHTDWMEFAELFAVKFCTFLELNAVELFRNVSETPCCEVDAMEKDIEDAKRELNALWDDYAELRQSVVGLMGQIRENTDVLKENAVLKERLKLLSDLNVKLMVENSNLEGSVNGLRTRRIIRTSDWK